MTVRAMVVHMIMVGLLVKGGKRMELKTIQNIDIVVKQAFLRKEKNRLYGLLREREKRGEWQKFLDTISIELEPLLDETIFSTNLYFITLLYKISTLRRLNDEFFRKTIFECMNLIEVVIVNVLC